MKTLKIDCSKFSEEQMIKLDETLVEQSFNWLSYHIDVDNKTLFFYKTIDMKKWELTFSDYIDAGKFLKEWLLTNTIITDRKDNTLFSLSEQSFDESVIVASEDPELLDKKLVQVPQDDPKLVAALWKLNVLKKSKLN
jgi:hypothetical protein